ncbi:phosphoglycerate kinase [Candidatus Uhrbacteria bacterium]|nr:phosphoglycerate kinase [Candidatus Uhrbacteria bacterium]
MKSARELKNIRGKRVLVRVDFNVPLAKSSVHSSQFTVEDDTRINAAIPTIEFLLKKGAKVVLMSHFGRPGKIKNVKLKMKNDLEPIVDRLSELLKKKAGGVEKWDFTLIYERIKKMKAGGILMLPNLRLHPGEEKNSAAFARDLAGLGQIYVNEAFSVCHRKHASVVGVPKFLPSYAGLQLMKEVEVLSRVLHKPEKPLLALMGGGKIADKIALMRAMVKRANAVLVGGALATHFFKAMGYGVGDSRIEAEGVQLAKKLVGNHRHGGASKKIVLPRDVVVGRDDGEGARVVEVLAKSQEQRAKSSTPYALCSKPDAVLDIGPQTILEYAKHIKGARTLIWNGPMGLYEIKRYSHGTLALGRLFAARSRGRAFGVAGGGETIDALNQTGMLEYVDFVSTGGGAMLEFLGGRKLPGIEALHNTEKH